MVDLALGGEALAECASRHLPDLYAGQPALLSLRLLPQGGTIEVSGRTADGPFDATVEVPAANRAAAGPAERDTDSNGTGSNDPDSDSASAPLPLVCTRYGRELAEDLAVLGAADPKGVDRRLEEVGLRYRIATAQTAWVAISQEAQVNPDGTCRRVVQPQALPQGMSVEGLGLRAASVRGAAIDGSTRARIRQIESHPHRKLRLTSRSLRSFLEAPPERDAAPAPASLPPLPVTPLDGYIPEPDSKPFDGTAEYQRWVGRVALQRGRILVLILTVPSDCRPGFGPRAFVQLEDGTVLRAELHPPGKRRGLRAGQPLRIRLLLEATPHAPVARIELPDAQIEVHLP